MNAVRHRAFGSGILAAAASPLLWLLLFYSFVLRARLRLGVWPRPYQPDPKTLDFTIHHTAIYLGIPAVSIVGFCAVVLALRRYARGVAPFPWLLIGCLAVGAALMVVLARIDPGDYFAWFLD